MRNARVMTPEPNLSQVFWEDDNAWYRGTVTGYHISTCNHTILYDDEDVEKVCLDYVPHRYLALHLAGQNPA